MRLPLQRRPASMRGWPCTLFAFRLPRYVAHAAHGELVARIAHAAQVASMAPMQPLPRCSQHARTPVHKSLQIRQTQSLRRRSLRVRTRLAGCIHRSAHEWFQLGVASVVPSGRVARRVCVCVSSSGNKPGPFCFGPFTTVFYYFIDLATVDLRRRPYEVN